MKPSTDRSVCDFLITALPEDVLGGLRILSTLKIPVHDRASLEAALGDSNESAGRKYILQLFTPLDFPITSVQSAFEKYFARLAPLPIPGLRSPFREGDLPDFTYRPSACHLYDREPTFTRAQADCACRTYTDAIRAGNSELQAVVAGHFAGRRAHPVLGCRD